MDSLEFSTWSTDSQGADLEIEDSQGADLEIESDTSSTTTGRYACETDDTASQSSCEELEELYESFCESFDETQENEEHRLHSHLKDTPLYSGSTMSSYQTLILIFQFVLRHGLSNKVFTELLQLLLVLLPKSTNLPRSVYLFKKLITELFPETKTKVQEYCTQCQKLLESSGSVCTCENERKTNKFVTVPIGPQLKRMFEDPHTRKCLQLRFEWCHSDGELSDVYDGEAYKKYADFLGQPGCVSLSFNTDGVAIYRSSQVSIWPVWFVVNELPIKMRYSKKHMILAAIWYSRNKPVMNTFLRPIVDELNSLYHQGITAITPAGKVKVHAICILASMDLPARAIVTNTKQFNGEHGCLYCEHPGIPRPNNHRVRSWPHIDCCARTHSDIIECAKSAVLSGKPVKGIKGPCVLSLHPCFKVNTGVVVDDLHGLYLGVSKTFLKFWFHKSFRTKDFYIGDHIEQCNTRLLSIQVPDVISRTPKTLKDYQHWKASEMRNWILYFSLPVLHGILPEPYISHFSLLVAALQLLSSVSVTQNDLQYAADCISTFLDQFPDLYGQDRATMNIHLLEHVTTCVKNWGPLWAYSCFAFEGMNAHLKHLFHGTRDMSTQMAFCHVAFQCLPELLDSPLFNNLPRTVMTFVDILFGRTRTISKQKISDTVSLVGGSSLTKIDENLQCEIPSQFRCPDYQAFYRAEIDGEMFYSKDYSRVKKRNSYTVMFKQESTKSEFGQILRFIYVPGCGSYCLLSQLMPVSTPSIAFDLMEEAIDYSARVFEVCTTSVVLVPLSAVVSKCIFIAFEGKSFVALMNKDIVLE